MPNISYHYRGNVLCATWPGRSVRKGNKVTKEGQVYLGKVINKEKNIFWSKAQGYFVFDPDTQSISSPDPADIPETRSSLDSRMRPEPIIVDFGDSYFLDTLIRGIGYNEVLDCIPYSNGDTLKSMIAFYTLEDKPNSYAETWFSGNYASFLYPRANLASQRLSEFMAYIGRPEARRAFFLKHIEYILQSTNEELCVLVDSTGLPNKCGLDITVISNHDGDVNLEFRLIVVVQKSTGLPLYYECIAGNIIDISTVERVILTMAEYGCHVEYCIGDAGYCCPANLERLLYSGIDFMSRLKPNLNFYKDAVAGHLPELDDEGHLVRYGGRMLYIVKIPAVVGHDADGRDVTGYIFLCRDIEKYEAMCLALTRSEKAATRTSAEIAAEKKSFGLFAIITTRDVTPEGILPEYYMRQGIEQFFDFAKNYAKLLPVRFHKIECVQGHLLLSFIATFFMILVNRRMGAVKERYVAVPAGLASSGMDGPAVLVQDGNGKDTFIMAQDTPPGLKAASPKEAFYALKSQKADVYATVLIPSVPVKLANDFYKAYRLNSPSRVRLNGREPVPEFFPERKQTKSLRATAFAFKPWFTDEEILAKRAQTAKKDETAGSVPHKDGPSTASPEETPGDTSEGSPARQAGTEEYSSASKATDAHPAGRHKRGGRKKGSKNRKTLEREAQEAKLAAEGKLPPKRRPGRPKGSLNKKTIAHLEEEERLRQAGLLQPKRHPGRPIGSKNKKS